MSSIALRSRVARHAGRFWRFPSVAGLFDFLRRPIQRPAEMEALRDSGARREVQDYATAAPLEAAAPRRLHRIAEAALSSLPRT